MLNKICVYTCIYGDYEVLSPPPSSLPGVDFICFTDDPLLRCRGWECIFVPIDNGESPSFFYKRIKLNPYTYLSNYDYAFWVDANFSLTSHWESEFYLNKLLSKNILLYKHVDPYPHLMPCVRKSLYEEALFCISSVPKYKKERLREQIQSYATEQMPKDFGLFNSGFFLVNMKSDDALDFLEFWLSEILKWGVVTPQCQVSLPYSLWKTGISFDVIKDRTIYDPRDFVFKPHKHGF